MVEITCHFQELGLVFIILGFLLLFISEGALKVCLQAYA